MPSADNAIAEHPTPGVHSRNYRDVVGALATAQKTTKGAPAYSRFVNRRLGRYLAAAAYLLGITPNGVTAISAFFSFAGIAAIIFLSPSLFTGVLVCICLVVGYAFDAADGQLARLRGGGSPSGEWLDHMVDATKISSLHLAVLISLYRYFDLTSAGWLLVPMGFSVVAAVMFFGMILNEQLRRNATQSAPVADRGNTSGIRSLLVIPTDYGLLCAVFILLAIPPVFLLVYAFLFVCNAGFMFLAAFKWFGDMKALGVSSR